ncbi:MAG TPA: ACP S-malonyltransferase [Candidatus Omnitrophota bacterium]|nr:ACP S-malonyltransferase [Candidatus Omnitrophota bacterium]
MKNVALIFPGQGAQKVGMGKEFFDSSPQARAIFEKADQILKNNLCSVAFEGPQEKLTSTAYCQPAILTFSIAALQALKAHPKFKNINPTFSAGLSLGEYSALIAAGALSFEEGLRLVERRSFFMEEAAKSAQGKMAAVIGFSAKGGSASGGDAIGRLQEICRETGAEIANFNSLEQIVITGHALKVEAACEAIRGEGARSVIMLDVSGAFHSSLMQPAAAKFEGELKKAAIRPAQFAVLSNVDALPETDPEKIRRNLARQITSSVQWVATVQKIAREGVVDFIELGPGTVLKGLIRRINPDLKVYNIQKPQDIENLPF